MPRRLPATIALAAFAATGAAGQTPVPGERDMVAAIREEGLHRSGLPETLSYLTDVIGARVTNSAAMERAQRWAVAEMERIGLSNVAREPFMDYGASWDNEYFSLHLTEPVYRRMTGYPIAHTPGTDGRLELSVVIADVRSRGDLDGLRGKLRGLAVLSTPPAAVDRSRFATGTPERSDEEMRRLAGEVLPRSGPEPVFRSAYADAPANPELLTPVERLAFYLEEGAAAVLESRSGWPGAVRGFARPGAKVDRWDREATLSSLPIIAVTPEHYNRMYRVRRRGLPVAIELEVRNRHGEGRTEARNVFGEIPGSDLADEVVMIGAHFDTWHASPNASDNSSGTAVMLEAMRILQAVSAAPRRTIRLALWSGEEQGIFGSRAYVRERFGDPADPEAPPTPDYERFSVYFNQDYGPGRYRGVWLQGNERARPVFEAWMAPFADFGMTTLAPGSVGSTDHVPFDDAGLPAFQFLQARVGGTGGHTNLDFYDTLPVDDLKKNAVVVAAFAWNAAMADARMPRKGRKPDPK